VKRQAGLDPRVWLLWGASASLPSLLGRNPFPIAACLIVAVTVRATIDDGRDQAWGTLLRLAVVFAAIGVLFNMFTYHGGDREFAVIPGWVPIAGGPLTLNALVYGLVSGLALVTLVVVWSTVAQRISWSDMVRLAPPSLASLTVAGAVAMALTPRTVEAYGEIREAQALRGYRPHGARDIVPIAAPLLTLGLERAVTMSEALESRGFGGPPEETNRGAWFSIGLIGTITGIAAAAFLISSGKAGNGLILLVASLSGFLALVRSKRAQSSYKPTRYREVRFGRRDRIVGGVCLIAGLLILTINALNQSALFYEPYPTISWPTVSLSLIAAIGLLMAPALITPQPERRS
jgi:energy-coupling factor transport system permease protein